jgi:hypothetical protein
MDDTTKVNEELLDQVTAEVAARILLRVARDLTDSDVDALEKIDEDDKTGKKVMRFLYEKVPNFETIVFEELQKARQQASA